MPVSKKVHTAFDAAHPAVPALYAACTLGLTMFSMHPVLIALSLLGGFSYLSCVRGPAAALGSLRWQLPVIAVIALVNPLFVQMGSTELFQVFGRPVFLESMLYGLAMAGLFLASVQWFAGCSHMLTYDKALSLFGNAVPTVALMISMTMRLVPRFLRQGRTIASVQDVALSCGSVEADSTGGFSLGGRPLRAASRLRQTSVLMGWAMEDSLETAGAMRARGWGACRRRTTYVPYRFARRDAASMMFLLVLGLCSIWASWTVTSGFAFYPQVSRVDFWWGYLPYATWMLLPTAMHLYESRRFA